MTKTKARKFTRPFKLVALDRMAAGENVCALARELKLRRKLLYDWRDKLRKKGPEALRGKGRPRKAVAGAAIEGPAMVDGTDAGQRIAELERKIGRQQVELDFFRRALRQVGGPDRARAGSGAGGSTRSSKP